MWFWISCSFAFVEFYISILDFWVLILTSWILRILGEERDRLCVLLFVFLLFKVLTLVVILFTVVLVRLFWCFADTFVVDRSNVLFWFWVVVDLGLLLNLIGFVRVVLFSRFDWLSCYVLGCYCGLIGYCFCFVCLFVVAGFAVVNSVVLFVVIIFCLVLLLTLGSCLLLLCYLLLAFIWILVFVIWFAGVCIETNLLFMVGSCIVVGLYGFNVLS